jgi:hypothetical protein
MNKCVVLRGGFCVLTNGHLFGVYLTMLPIISKDIMMVSEYLIWIWSMQTSECVLFWGSIPIFATRNLGERKSKWRGRKTTNWVEGRTNKNHKNAHLWKRTYKKNFRKPSWAARLSTATTALVIITLGLIFALDNTTKTLRRAYITVIYLSWKSYLS